MNAEQTELVAIAGGAVALVLLLACALLWRTSRRLAARIDELERERRTPSAASAPVVTEPAAYVITSVAEAEAPSGVVPGRIDGALFADIGLRRALSAESRNRIRFEFRREVKRSRKQRRADLKAALRHLQAQEDAA